MPCKGNGDQIDEFNEVLEQLHEICEKYQSSSTIVIGGDFNEDITLQYVRRYQSLTKFINEHCFVPSYAGKTFIHPNGHDTTTIDYFIVPTRDGLTSKINVITDLHSNTSDHYPVTIQFHGTITKPRQLTRSEQCSTKTIWKKVDIDLYKALVTEGAKTISISSNDRASVAKATQDVHNLLKDSVINSTTIRQGPLKKRRSNNLQVWNEDIKAAILRKAYYEWKVNGRSNNPTNSYLTARKMAKQALRRSIRVAVALKTLHSRAEIMEARLTDTNKLYKLIGKQRGKLSSYISELSVDGKTYEGAGVIEGWREHFNNLAQPANNPCFNDSYQT